MTVYSVAHVSVTINVVTDIDCELHKVYCSHLYAVTDGKLGMLEELVPTGIAYLTQKEILF